MKIPFENMKDCIHCLNWTNANTQDSSVVGNKDFQRLQTLGVGTYGKVLLVRKESGSDHGRLYAMKITSKRFLEECKGDDSNDDDDYSWFHRFHVGIVMTERHVLEAVRNKPFLAQMQYAFQTHSNLYLVLDYYNGGSLYPHFKDSSLAKIVFYVAQITLAVEQLHNLGIVHRDLKSENIVFDKQGNIRLVDFGLSAQLLHDNEIKMAMEDVEIGTTEYMAPEIVNLEEHGFAANWWSLGVITYFLPERKLPFNAGKRVDLMDKIVTCEPTFRPGAPLVAKKFVQGLSIKDPAQRLGARCGAIELKKHPLFVDVDWDRMANKGYGALVKPVVREETDTSNFLKKFTDLAPADSVGCQAPCDTGLFIGYRYTSLNSTEDEDILKSEALIPVTEL